MVDHLDPIAFRPSSEEAANKPLSVDVWIQQILRQQGRPRRQAIQGLTSQIPPHTDISAFSVAVVPFLLQAMAMPKATDQAAILALLQRILLLLNEKCQEIADTIGIESAHQKFEYVVETYRKRIDETMTEPAARQFHLYQSEELLRAFHQFQHGIHLFAKIGKGRRGANRKAARALLTTLHASQPIADAYHHLLEKTDNHPNCKPQLKLFEAPDDSDEQLSLF
ncbi:hypothetical protein [Pontibacter sp. G13]|uniref:hypothetical protein n=1 Tax=Pontibacter sp. G13 TaxID=3074898 RepID=UPI00288AE8A6|nr:hypothetical protein [Pontibacter sp. G13]WNJ20627.1 hypothetical protein RJD25_09095 [Pontibacter sp. G13]